MTTAAHGAAAETDEALDRAIAELGEARVPEPLLTGLRALREDIGKPCVVAVVGQVNAGKSMFINALLGEDKALVGSTETTATINHFVYGEPDPERPVRCFWRGGRVTEESGEFLASLQGSDREALERAEGLDRLEYLVPHPLLKTLMLVDTPGRGAVVERHEERSAAFLDVEQRLRARHDGESQRIQQAADAIIYLVGAVARASDRDLLEQFATSSAQGATAMNALGVVAKIDLNPEVLARRHELAGKIRGQLDRELNDVVPVSAALARALDQLEAGDAMSRIVDVARAIPANQLDQLLQNEELFCDYDPPGCPVPAAERRRVRTEAGCGWRVFATIVDEARGDDPPDKVLTRLRDLAGFDRLRQTLRDHFLERADILRCDRIVRDARSLMRRAWFEEVRTLLSAAQAGGRRLERFLAFVDGAGGDPAVADELAAFLREQLDGDAWIERLQAAFGKAELDLGRLGRRLGEYNADFAALQTLEGAATAFSADEFAELRALLGMYGTEAGRRMNGQADLSRCVDRQLHWRVTRDRAPRASARAVVADRAHARLGLMMEELS
jgi:GTPase SAR1 family protein